MKIIQKLQQAHNDQRVCWSFEYFPPKTEQVSPSVVAFWCTLTVH